MPAVENRRFLTIGGVLPMADTRPAVADGVEVLCASIPPTGPGKAIRVQVRAPMSGGGPDQGAGIAAFRDGEAVAFDATWSVPNNTQFVMTPLVLDTVIPGSAGWTTVRIRAGRRSASIAHPVYLNGHVGGRMGGGASVASLTLTEVPSPWPDELYIVAGQSNAAGRGLLSEVPVYGNAGRCRVFSKAGAWMTALEPASANEAGGYPILHDAEEPGASAIVSFADRLAIYRPQALLGVVPCAVGGWWMEKWARNLATIELYGAMLARVQAALSFGGTVKGFIWYQGESDATQADRVSAWPGRFAQLVTDLRADLALPSLPTIMTVIGPDPVRTDFAFWPQMVAAQSAMTLPAGCVRVTANDLAAKPGDTIHLTTNSLRALGQRWAEALNPLL